MTVKEFIETYRGNIECLEIKKYVPIEDKLSSINSVLQDIISADGKITASYNTVTLEIMKVITAIALYTNLEVASLDDYDVLAENHLIQLIIESIGDDVYFFYEYFNDRKADYIREKNSWDGILGRFVGELSKLTESLDPKMIEELLSLLQNKE